MTWTFLAGLAWKASLLLGASWGAAFLLRRASAATRHLVWTCATAGLLALPVLPLLLPPLETPRALHLAAFPAAAEGPAESASGIGPETGAAVDWRGWLVRLWMAGAAALLLRLAGALAALRRLIRRSRPLDAELWRSLLGEVSTQLGCGRRVRLLESDGLEVPVSCGVGRPVVLLPAGCEEWSEPRKRIVLLHEVAHAARLDPLTQLLTRAACCVYWFHPLAWLSARRMSMERERACDDRVLVCGAAPADYAGHLVEIARGLRARRHWPAAAIAMASRSQLEPRLAAILDKQLRRRGLTRRKVAAAGCAVLAVVVPLAAMRPQPAPEIRAQEKEKGATTMSTKLAAGFLAGSMAFGAGVSGRVYDPSKAVVPGARVVLANTETGAEVSTETSPAGEYQFLSVVPGRYELRVLVPGFVAARRGGITLQSDSQRHESFFMKMGEIQETLTVTAAGTPRPQPAVPRRIRVGGNVQATRLLEQVRPTYPEKARSEGREGSVMMQAVILMDGTIGGVAATPDSDPELAAAAVEAVRQWRYSPTRLNGQPVEVATTVTVHFRLTP